MKHILLTSALGLIIAGCVSTPSVAPADAPSGAYVVDPNHTSVIWRIGHANGLSQYTARFDTIDAALDFDPAEPALSRVSARIAAASVSTGLPDFDAKLAGAADVFNADAHPYITFETTSVTVTGATSADVTGDLTLRGVTAPVTLSTTYNGAAFDPLRGADVVGFSASGSFSRAEFGADAWSAFGVGDTITVWIEAEFMKQ